ncbi:hypothetical protein EDB80DRAFT_900152 [Ilyonectria destructans]|nr:hypothetical protein EDB80DRAFT_900152 [Ilyonectria destructans]
MPRRHRSRNDEYDSDDSPSPENVVFDLNQEVSDAETDITEIDPLDDVDCHVDIEDLPDLLDGAVYPPEYYRRIAEEVFDKQDYSPGTERLLNAVEDHWSASAERTDSGTRINASSRFTSAFDQLLHMATRSQDWQGKEEDKGHQYLQLARHQLEGLPSGLREGHQQQARSKTDHVFPWHGVDYHSSTQWSPNISFPTKYYSSPGCCHLPQHGANLQAQFRPKISQNPMSTTTAGLP